VNQPHLGKGGGKERRKARKRADPTKGWEVFLLFLLHGEKGGEKKRREVEKSLPVATVISSMSAGGISNWAVSAFAGRGKEEGCFSLDAEQGRRKGRRPQLPFARGGKKKRKEGGGKKR